MLSQGRGRAFNWIWRLSVFALLVGGLSTTFVASASGPQPQAHASADVLLETLTVIRPVSGSSAADYERRSATDLVAGTTYRIVVSGDVAQHYAGQIINIDALYCFGNFGTPPSFGTCTPPRRGTPNGPLRFAIGGSTPVDLDKLPGYTGALLPYAPDHRYEVTVVAPATGSLVISQLVGLIDSAPGAWTIQIYGPAPGTIPPPQGSAPPVVTQGKIDFLAAAKHWGRGQVVTSELPPGGSTVLESPPISQGQRNATIKIDGPVIRDSYVMVRLTAGYCLRAFLKGIIVSPKKTGSVDPAYVTEALGFSELSPEDAGFLRILAFMACLEEVRQADQQAGKSVASSVRATAARCRTLSPSRFKVRYDEASRKATYRRLRPSRRQARRLRVSCRAGAGGLKLTIGTRSRHTKLRSVVGPRLQVGLYRSSKSEGSGELRASFTR